MTKRQTYQKIQEVADKIAKEHRPEKIILFGSYAWGEPTKDSDVDLFIVKETENTRETAIKIDGSIFPRPFPVDLIVYTPAKFKKELNLEEPFVSKITRQGKILFENL
ncbi:MAG: nucleotidyltransferase domain-containing protein [Parcubacteria group bacterium]|nr:nucleotidyltransferase domain-containing protein [Parcubacteria group bacterium]